jgi:REP element-mobilizing transposase RayT
LHNSSLGDWQVAFWLGRIFLRGLLEVDIQGDKRRKSFRLRGYDYANEGAYFVTLVTHKRQCIFGNVIEEGVELSKFGEIARHEWLTSAAIRQEIELFEDEIVIMPNHIHGIVWIHSKEHMRATHQSPLQLDAFVLNGPKPKSLGAFVLGYKGAVTRKISKLTDSTLSRVWMRNYHDRIIRNPRELEAIRKYIFENPLKWKLDRYYQSNNS